MKTKILSIFTRTPLHVGAGSSVGAIDMPVVRERHTRFPVIPGSSIKGVLADLWNDGDNVDEKYIRKLESEARKIFGDNVEKGKNACAGKIAFGEGKLLAFPIRSAIGCFAFITCPLALSRFAVDKNLQLTIPEITDTSKAIVADSSIVGVNGKVILEEYPLDIQDKSIDAPILSSLKELSDDPIWVNNIEKRLIIISDELFSYFVENACEVQTRICVDDETGVVKKGALFNQENVPSEALFYSVLNEFDETCGNNLKAKLDDTRLIQIGGDFSIGLGWCAVSIKEAE
mgnify:CR=1 FL=1